MEKLILSAVIIDDEPDAIFVLVDLLNNFSNIKIVGTALNLRNGVELIKQCRPDIVFLDINMPGHNGLEIFIEFKSPSFKIIFCTAYHQYAIELLRKNSRDFLLKPVDITDLQRVIQKVYDEFLLEQQKLQLEDKINILNTTEIVGKDIMLNVESGFLMYNTKNIEYCSAKLTHSVVVTHTQKEIIVLNSLKELQEILPENQFYKTHKSYLVNVYYIRKFVHTKDSYLILASGAEIPVSIRVSAVITGDIKKKLKV